MEQLSTRCCIVGGGPAGMMLGYLLARAGIEVQVLEKHADFLRDFRGDTIHPSTLEVMHELGLLDELLKLPHQKAPRLNARFGDVELTIADFSHLPVRCPYIAFMPQWDFLSFLARQAGRYPTFHLRMQTEVTELIQERERVVGLWATTSNGLLEVRADLVVGADGRHSVVRARAALPVEDFGAPMDVLWFHLSRRAEDPVAPTGRFEPGRIFVMLNRDEYWQCGYVIPKGAITQIHEAGLPAFRNNVAAVAPFVVDRVQELQDWSSIKLLTVKVDRLRRWSRPGLLCIGDAAHAMSPIGGVGINLAIQDAVAASNLLAEHMRNLHITPELLSRVQQRRQWPTRVTQRMQMLLQKRVIGRLLSRTGALKTPLFVRLLARVAFLRRIPAWLIGMGVRPEHVRTSERSSSR
jgi:2-polyprenyl-6-methoxyphenol hydroxylase-like FAD-dependent oxidoreductase